MISSHLDLAQMAREGSDEQILDYLTPKFHKNFFQTFSKYNYLQVRVPTETAADTESGRSESMENGRTTQKQKIIPSSCVHRLVLVVFCSKEYAGMAKCLITKSWLNFLGHSANTRTHV